MALKKKLAAAAFGVLAMGGIGAGVANATTTTPPAPAISVPAADALTPGDTADAPGAVDTPEAGEGDQNGPDTAGPEVPDAPGAPGAPAK